LLHVALLIPYHSTHQRPPATEPPSPSLHDALPIYLPYITADATGPKHLDVTLTRAKFNELTAHLVDATMEPVRQAMSDAGLTARSEEHTSELQSRFDLVCRLLLEKKKSQEKNDYI